MYIFPVYTFVDRPTARRTGATNVRDQTTTAPRDSVRVERKNEFRFGKRGRLKRRENVEKTRGIADVINRSRRITRARIKKKRAAVGFPAVAWRVSERARVTRNECLLGPWQLLRRPRTHITVVLRHNTIRPKRDATIVDGKYNNNNNRTRKNNRNIAATGHVNDVYDGRVPSGGVSRPSRRVIYIYITIFIIITRKKTTTMDSTMGRGIRDDRLNFIVRRFFFLYNNVSRLFRATFL